MSRISSLVPAAALLIGLVAGSGSASAQVTNADVTSAGGTVVGVGATPGSNTSTLAGIGTVANTNNHPAGEPPSAGIDNSHTSKYLNFGKTNVGFITTL